MKIFLVIQGIIYIVIVSGDVVNYMTSDWSNSIKLFSVFVCFMYLLLTLNLKAADRDHLLMVGVIAVTLLADAIILFTDLLSIGVFVFVIVQVLYAYRISLSGQIRNRYRTYFRATVPILLASLFIQNETLIITAVVLYGVLFLLNLWFLITIEKNTRQSNILFKTGFVLFLICDINVLLFNILPNYGITNQIYEFTRVSMWFFYLPSQVLLSLSAVNENLKSQIR